jgi:hypothetical protein
MVEEIADCRLQIADLISDSIPDSIPDSIAELLLGLELIADPWRADP